MVKEGCFKNTRTLCLRGLRPLGLTPTLPQQDTRKCSQKPKSRWRGSPYGQHTAHTHTHTYIHTDICTHRCTTTALGAQRVPAGPAAARPRRAPRPPRYSPAQPGPAVPRGSAASRRDTLGPGKGSNRGRRRSDLEKQLPHLHLPHLSQGCGRLNASPGWHRDSGKPGPLLSVPPRSAAPPAAAGPRPGRRPHEGGGGFVCALAENAPGPADECFLGVARCSIQKKTHFLLQQPKSK